MKATKRYKGQQNRELTIDQQNAVDALVAGNNDRETAELVKVNRVTVSKWRLYDPIFQAALNQRRRETWGAAVDKLRDLLPEAIDVLASVLRNKMSRNRVKFACEILRMAQVPSQLAGIGPTDPKEIVRLIVLDRRSNAQGVYNAIVDDGKNLPPLEEHLQDVWEELESLIAEEEGSATA